MTDRVGAGELVIPAVFASWVPRRTVEFIGQVGAILSAIAVEVILDALTVEALVFSTLTFVRICSR